jgi:hypothetical protein
MVLGDNVVVPDAALPVPLIESRNKQNTGKEDIMNVNILRGALFVS